MALGRSLASCAAITQRRITMKKEVHHGMRVKMDPSSASEIRTKKSTTREDRK